LGRGDVGIKKKGQKKKGPISESTGLRVVRTERGGPARRVGELKKKQRGLVVQGVISRRRKGIKLAE